MTPQRVCSTVGCPNFTGGPSRCKDCRSAYERDRGTRQERGYDKDHDAQRAAVQRRIDAGEPVTCWRCGVRLQGRAWHLDHTADRDGYRGPACVDCNLHLAGIAAHQEPR